MKTIFIIDDDDKNRKLLRVILTIRGYNILEAEDGEQGVAEVRKSLPGLIFLDYRLPVMDGIAVSRLLKSEAATAKIPIIIVTSSAMKGDKERIIRESGCDGFITKPVDINKVVEIAKKYIGPGKEE